MVGLRLQSRPRLHVLRLRPRLHVLRLAHAGEGTKSSVIAIGVEQVRTRRVDIIEPVRSPLQRAVQRAGKGAEEGAKEGAEERAKEAREVSSRVCCEVV